MRITTRKIATTVAGLAMALGFVAVTSVPAHADTSWGYVKAPTSTR